MFCILQRFVTERPLYLNLNFSAVKWQKIKNHLFYIVI
jgi:hypothetical protein